MLSSLAWQRILFLMPLEACNIDENEQFGVLAGVCLEPGLDPHPILSACAALLQTCMQSASQPNTGLKPGIKVKGLLSGLPLTEQPH